MSDTVGPSKLGDLEAVDVEESSSSSEEEIDPFLQKPFRDKIRRRYRKTKRFFRRKEVRKEVLRGIWPRIKNYYVEPESPERVAVKILMIVTILYNMIFVPYRVCFEKKTHPAFRVFDVLTDVVAWVNIVMQLFQAVEVRGELIKTRTRSLYECLSIGFLCECIAYLLPLDYFSIGKFYTQWTRIHRLLGAVLFDFYFETLEKMAAKFSFLNFNPVIIRIFKFVFYLLVAIHFFACIYILNANAGHRFSNFLMPGASGDILMQDVFQSPQSSNGYNPAIRVRQYLGSLYFSSVFIVGYATTLPQNESDTVYSLFTVVVGTGLFATIVGTVVALINQLGATEKAFEDKMQNIKDFMRFRNVKQHLQKDAFSFFSIVQRSGRGLNQEEIMGDLEISIKRNISQYLHRGIVGQVPLFQECGELFIQDICQYLKYTLLLKDYKCVNKGEVGKEMFFIGRGSVQVISEDGSVVFATLQAGKFFGEIALLSEDARRTASIRAAELCEVYILTKEDFDQVIDRYPTAKQIMKAEVEKRKIATEQMKAKVADSKKMLKNVVKLGAALKKRDSNSSISDGDKSPTSPNPSNTSNQSFRAMFKKGSASSNNQSTSSIASSTSNSSSGSKK